MWRKRGGTSPRFDLFVWVVVLAAVLVKQGDIHAFVVVPSTLASVGSTSTNTGTTTTSNVNMDFKVRATQTRLQTSPSNNNDNQQNSNDKSQNNNNNFVNDFLSNVGKFFGSPEATRNMDLERSATKDYASRGTGQLLVSLQAKSIKVGALRLLLTLHLMGQQNTPHKATWKCNQSAEGDLDMYFVPDQSGAVTVELSEEYGIQIYSQGGGESQSNAFLMQQTVLLESLLHELEQTIHPPPPPSGAPTVKEVDKLLVLQNPNALTEARDALSFA
jgi:hypothetical protein